MPLGWAGVLAISIQPLFRELATRIGRSRAAGVCVLIVVLLLVLPVWLLVDALVTEGAQAVDALQGAVSATPPERMVALWGWVQTHVPWLAPERLSETLGSLAQRLGSVLASGSGRLLGGIAVLVLDLALALFALFFFLRDAPAIVGVLRSFLPFHEQQRDRVVKQVEDLVFASVIAGLAVAAVQGFLGGLGFWIVGVRAPAVWGTVMAFMSLVPLVGASIVWAPVALWFLLTGDITRGLVLIGIGGGLVGMADNILRPAVAERPLVDERTGDLRGAARRDVGLRLDRAGLRARRGGGRRRRCSTPTSVPCRQRQSRCKRKGADPKACPFPIARSPSESV